MSGLPGSRKVIGAALALGAQRYTCAGITVQALDHQLAVHGVARLTSQATAVTDESTVLTERDSRAEGRGGLVQDELTYSLCFGATLGAAASAQLLMR